MEPNDLRLSAYTPVDRLARPLGHAAGTVEGAYRLLVRMGLVSSSRGYG